MAVTQDHVEKVLELTSHEGKPALKVAPTAVSGRGIPSDWAGILASPDARTHVIDVLWQPMAPRFRKTLKEMKRSLQGVGLLTTASRPPSLIYFFTLKEEGLSFFYRGYAPAAKRSARAAQLPDEFLQFYAVHDGWLDEFDSMGPMAEKDWSALSTEPPGDEFLVVFYGAGGALLGYDLRKSPPLCYVIPAGDAPPEVVPNVWARIDRLAAARLEEMRSFTAK